MHPQVAALYCELAKRPRAILVAAVFILAIVSFLRLGYSPLPSSAIARSTAPRDEYLAICLAVKDQGLDLPEWLQHHYHHMGVGKFYIMDDASQPPMSSFADTLGIPASAVEFHHNTASERVPSMQHALYQKCSELGGDKHEWMAFIDADEFLDAPGPETLRDVLKGFEPIQVIGAVGVSWRMHTSNGQQVRQPSVRKAFTECIFDDEEHHGEGSDNRHVKSIVRLGNFHAASTPHFFLLNNDTITVGEHGDMIKDSFRPPTRDRLALHHYAVKSRQEMEEKAGRGNAMDQPKSWDFWDHVESKMPHVPCPEMARWVQ
ncbi:hypothetical protein G6O67_005415 [Ophiocordyceps sinensis]|uniref:Uncharacterized protein n=3 Tax=Ophiocordyceps sinensis TaxID=72228 RepID=A0A8H4PRL8_9HYPO|nr:hypothetical protein OCS_03444 [Ophiocordyceps sinensis CO18]KAF4509113.1 hypothetical protein G6O67_005415 [Ophiocordyceps sinensis]